MVQEKTRILYQVIVPERFYGVIFNGHPKQESHPGNHIVAVEIKPTGHQEVYKLSAVTLESAEAVSTTSEDNTILIHGEELRKVMFYLD